MTTVIMAKRVLTRLFLSAGLLVFISATVARAELATSDEMRNVCANWITHSVRATGAWADEVAPTIGTAEDIIVDGRLVARCYSVDPVGYVVVPVLKELPSVKAYSDESNLDIHAADGMALLLRQILQHRVSLYLEVYGDLEASQPAQGEVLFGRSNRESWDVFSANPAEFAAMSARGTALSRDGVGPLLGTISWHQGDPYNLYCPPGTPVGCVATAAAQIMAYWQWPTEGTGSHSYGIHSATFWDSYDWDYLPDHCHSTCDADQQAELAELNYEVGVAFNMNYDPAGSGAYTNDAAWVFPTYFVYKNQTEIVNRVGQTSGHWFDVIKDEIDAGRPMQYRIYSHSIVLDGWAVDGGFDQYHMNYGWDEGHTMWYTVDELHCPWSGCHIYEERLIKGIEPDKSVMFTADTRVGWAPLSVHFEGDSELAVDDWSWDFGDGGSADTQSPDYVYNSGGAHNVGLQVTSGGQGHSRTKMSYVVALADTLVGDTVRFEPGMTDVEVVISAINNIPLTKITIPVLYPGVIDVKYDSFSTVGCRTDFFEERTLMQYVPSSKKLFFSLTTSLSGTSPDLDPGSGPVIKLYFHIEGTPVFGEETILILGGYTSGLNERRPMFYGSLADYEAAVVDAAVSYTGCCVIRGDVDHSGVLPVDIADMVYLVDYMFNGGSGPECFEEGDVDASDIEPIDIADMVYLVDYMFNGGSAPAACF